MKIRSNTPKESIFKKIVSTLSNKIIGIISTIFYIGIFTLTYYYAGNVALVWILGLVIIFNVVFTIVDEGAAIFAVFFVTMLMIPLFGSIDSDYEKTDINTTVDNIKLSPSNNKLVIYLKDSNPSMLVVDMADFDTDFYRIEQLEKNGYQPKVLLTEQVYKDLFDISGISDSFRYNYNIKFSMIKDKNEDEIFSRSYYENGDSRFDKRKFINK